jgi:hypothetical protein
MDEETRKEKGKTMKNKPTPEQAAAAKEIMMGDGAPACLFISEEARAEARSKVTIDTSKKETKPEAATTKETKPMMTFTNNTRGMTQMTEAKQYAEMSTNELVAKFNELAASPAGAAAGAKTVKRFADHDTAVKRVMTLYSALNNKVESETANPQPQTKATEMTTATKATTAKKATKATTAKKASATAAPTKAAKSENGSTNKIAAQFGARVGTVREKLLIALHDNYRKMVPVSTLIKAAYGKSDPEYQGALMMSLKGAQKTIEENKLPFEIKKGKTEEKEITIGLYPA